MGNIVLHDKTFRPFISHERIMEAIDKVAEKVNNDYRDSKQPPIVICVLNGSIMFTAELLQRLDFNCQLVSTKLSSYEGTESTGVVKSVIGLTSDVKGRDIIICEDIIETGNTIVALREQLIGAGAANVRICTMILKPMIYDKPVKLDYVAMEIPNDFIVGFGLDYNELGRNLKDIYVLAQ